MNIYTFKFEVDDDYKQSMFTEQRSFEAKDETEANNLAADYCTELSLKHGAKEVHFQLIKVTPKK